MPGPTIIPTRTPTDYEKPAENPPWWEHWTNLRRIAVFCLGAALIIDGLSRGDNPWAEFVIGAIMCGAFPLEEVIPIIFPPRHRHEHCEEEKP